MRLIEGLKWFALGLFLIIFYHVIIIPGLLDYSVYAFLPFALVLPLLIYLMPMHQRRNWAVFAIGVLLAFHALNTTNVPPGVLEWGAFGLILGVVGGVAFWYGRLNKVQVVALALAALLLVVLAPGEQMRLWGDFYLLAESPRTYDGDIFPYFPLTTLTSPEGDAVWVATWGNADEVEYEDGVEVLKPDSFYPYVYRWDNGLVRVPPEDLPDTTRVELTRMMASHYPAFPFYRYRSDGGMMMPNALTASLIEKIMDFGGAPKTALTLSTRVMGDRLEQGDGALDEAVLSHPDFEHAELRPGQLHLQYQGETWRYPTDATAIRGLITLEAGTGLVLQGSALEIVMPSDGQLRATHRLTAEHMPGLGQADVLIRDVDGNGVDEILLSSTRDPSRILLPRPDGSWEHLWVARDDDLTFRFEDVWDDDGTPEIVALDKSRVRDHPLRYLSGYELDPQGVLVARWRSLITLVDVRYADFDGDGSPELIGTRYGTHRFWVLKRHGLPVVPALWGIALMMAGVHWVRRKRGDYGA